MIHVDSVEHMQHFAEKIGTRLKGGEVLELIGDVGAGKTTFVRGLARGMGIDEQVQSPSFTINRVYDANDGRRLVHYDFYRLDNPGIMADELREALNDGGTVVVIEWADAVSDVLPSDRLTIQISTDSETSRVLTVHAGGESTKKLMEYIV